MSENTTPSLLYTQWNEAQHVNFGVLAISSGAFICAFVTALTQYVVTQWILKTDRETNLHGEQRPKVYWSSCFFVFWVLYILLSNSWLYDTLHIDERPSWNRIMYSTAVPLLVVLGVPFHILLDRVWTKTQQRNKSKTTCLEEEDAGANQMARDNNGNSNIEDQMENIELGEAQVETSAAPMPMTTTVTKKEKVHYINNIKIFLTNIVILHHITIAIGGDPYGGWAGDVIHIPDEGDKSSASYWILNTFISEDGAYFMGLFFFYSGFFVPKSFDKKGQRSFLFERVKRLGIPQVVYSFLIGPYIEGGLKYLLWDKNDQTDPVFTPSLYNSGTTWFLQQLIVFGILYSFVCKKGWSPKMECPTILGFFGWSLVIGVVTGTTTLFYSNQVIFNVPNFWRDYPQFVFFFFGGCIAQRNNWMTEIKTNRSRIAIYVWLALSLPIHFRNDFLPTIKNENLDGFINNVLTMGVMGMGNSLGVTVFFMDFVNGSYWCTKFFADSMYTAYILQFVPMMFATRCWVWVLQSINGIVMTTNDDGTIRYEYNNVNLMIPGFLMVGAITMIILWPLAYGIRSIPGFSRVL